MAFTNLSDLSTRRLPRIRIGSTGFALLITLLFVVFYNGSFFYHLVDVTNVAQIRGMLFVADAALLLTALTFIVISLFVIPRIGKPLLALIFLIAAGVAYFMHAYGIVIHRLMIQNVVETDTHEVLDLLNWKLFAYLLILGVLPSIGLWLVDIRFASFGKELWKRLKHIAIALICGVALIGSMHSDYIAFLRNHKDIRQMGNPLNFIYAGFSYAASRNTNHTVSPIENDATITAVNHPDGKPKLMVLVVGETARADHFGLNGYSRDTTPLLAKQQILNFSQVTSCGTETAVSVPCMFSNLGRSHFSDNKAKSQEGLLDVAQHAGVSVLWRDNNSGCKGACDRVPHENMQHLTVPGLCNDRECEDEILLHGLDDKLKTMTGDVLLVLHQKGSHGPDYFRRSSPEEEVFKPVCRSNELQSCPSDEVINAYDNTIRSTDRFLSATIDWLKSKRGDYDTAMVYLSDHGESLGENGIYLHGLPYMLAPDVQKHVPFVMWLSPDYVAAEGIDVGCVKKLSTEPFSQDNLFHTTLGMLNVSTKVYVPERDILHGCTSMQNIAGK